MIRASFHFSECEDAGFCSISWLMSESLIYCPHLNSRSHVHEIGTWNTKPCQQASETWARNWSAIIGTVGSLYRSYSFHYGPEFLHHLHWNGIWEIANRGLLPTPSLSLLTVSFKKLLEIYCQLAVRLVQDKKNRAPNLLVNISKLPPRHQEIVLRIAARVSFSIFW